MLKLTVIGLLCTFGITAPVISYEVNKPGKIDLPTETVTAPSRERALARKNTVSVEVTVLPEMIVAVNVPKRAVKKSEVTCEIGFIDGVQTVRAYRFCASPMYRSPVISRKSM